MSFGIGGGSLGTVTIGSILNLAEPPDVGPPPGTGLKIFVSGTEITGETQWHTNFHISASVDDRDTMQVGLIDHTLLVHFKVGQVIEAYISGVKVFGGFIDRVGENVPEGASFDQIAIECVDFNCLADRHLLAVRYETGQTLRQLVTAIVNVDSGELGERLKDDGVTFSNNTVSDAVIFGTLTFDYDTVTKAFDRLAELSGLWWEIDHNRVLYFVERTKFIAPKDLNPDVWADWTDLQIDRERGEYRNLQILRGGKDETDPESEVETVAGDGETQTFGLKFEVVVPKVGGVDKPPKVETDLGGGFVQRTVGVRSVDEGKDWYYKVGDKDITQDASGTKLTSSQEMRVTYTGQVPIIVQARQEDEIAARKVVEGQASATVSGVSAMVDDDTKINDVELAEEKALALLRRHSRIPNKARYKTFTSGFRPGQVQTSVLADHGISSEFLITEVSLEFSHFSPDDEEVYVYRIQSIDGETLGGWSNFFRRLAEKEGPPSHRENDQLVLLRQTDDVIILSDLATTADSLGSFLTDFASREMLGFPQLNGTVLGPPLGRAFRTSVNNPTTIYVAGPQIGLPMYPQVA